MHNFPGSNNSLCLLICIPFCYPYPSVKEGWGKNGSFIDKYIKENVQ